jgi:hypothetical protein
MRRWWWLAIAIAASIGCFRAVPRVQSTEQPSSEFLYKQHAWFSLEERIASGTVSDPLVLGATAAAMGEDAKARTYLEPLLGRKEAGEANAWLSYVDMRTGKNKRAEPRTMTNTIPWQPRLANFLTKLPAQQLHRPGLASFNTNSSYRPPSITRQLSSSLILMPTSLSLAKRPLVGSAYPSATVLPRRMAH